MNTTTLADRRFWPDLIKEYRLSLGLSRKGFGERYGVSRIAVIHWEQARNEAPYAVTWDVMVWLEGEEGHGR